MWRKRVEIGSLCVGRDAAKANPGHKVLPGSSLGENPFSKTNRVVHSHTHTHTHTHTHIHTLTLPQIRSHTHTHTHTNKTSVPSCVYIYSKMMNNFLPY